jgi:hypothetical protein
VTPRRPVRADRATYRANRNDGTGPDPDGLTVAAGQVTVTDTVAGRIHVGLDGTLVLVGEAEGGVVVTNGGDARITGRSEGLFVAVGGHATVTRTGVCQGVTVNDGGYLRIEGTVEGPVLEYAGSTIIVPAASITEATIHRLHHPVGSPLSLIRGAAEVRHRPGRPR